MILLKKLVSLVLLLAFINVVSAAMGFNQTFEVNFDNFTATSANIVCARNTTSPTIGVGSGWFFLLGGATTDACYSNFTRLSGNNTISFNLTTDATAGDWEFQIADHPSSLLYSGNDFYVRCIGGNWKAYSKAHAGYVDTGRACAASTAYSFVVLFHPANASDSLWDIQINGVGALNNTETSDGALINFNKIEFGAGALNHGGLFDNVCVCSGNWNTTCCAGVAGGSGVGANFSSPTPPDGDATNVNVTINVTCNETVNATYYLWFDFNDTSPSTLVINSTTNTTWTTNVSVEGNYTYVGGCSVNGTMGTNTSSRTWILSLSLPNITILSGNEFGSAFYLSTLNYSANADIFDKNFTINLTLEDTIGLYAYEILIYNESYVYVNVSNTTSLGGVTEYNLSRGFNSSNWSNNLYCVNISVSDSHTSNEIKEYTTITSKDALNFATAEGNNINIQALDAVSASTIKSSDRYSFMFDYSDSGKDRTYVLRTDKGVIDYLPNSRYKAHFIIFNNFKEGGNWIDFEGLEGKPIISKVSDQEYWITFPALDSKEVTFNSIGGLNIIYATYCVPQNSQYTSKNISGLHGSNTSIRINYTFFRGYGDDIYFISLNSLYINGTNYTNVDNSCQPSTQPIFNASSYDCNITINITLPTAAGVYTANITGYERFYNGSAGTLAYTYTSLMIPINITSSAWNVTNCTGDTTTQNVTITILFYDEENTPTQLVENWSVELVIWANETWNNYTFNYNFTNQNNYSICLNSNISLGSNAYTTYQNASNGYLNKYIWINRTLNSSQWNISAYGLQRNNLSDVRITNFNSANYDYFENSLVWLERRYLSEGVWRIVQMDKTDQYGLVTFKVIEESVDYRMVFYDENGNWLKNTTILKFACTAGVCLLDSYLNAFGSTSNDNLKYVYSYNSSTGIVSVYWNDTSNLTTSATLFVAKRTITGDTTICNNTNTTGITLICNISNQTGTIMAKFYTIQSPPTPEFVEWINRAIGNFAANLGSEGLMWVFILLVVIVMVGLIHPAATIFMAIAGLVAIFVLGMVSAVSLAVVIIAVVMGFAISVKMRK